MIFSTIHDWQGNPAVKQILVFSCQEMKDTFEKKYATRLEKDGEFASDSDIGAIYKLRAVMDSKSNWVPVIRCGICAIEIWEKRASYATHGEAMHECLLEFSAIQERATAAQCEAFKKK